MWNLGIYVKTELFAIISEYINKHKNDLILLTNNNHNIVHRPMNQVKSVLCGNTAHKFSLNKTTITNLTHR